MRQKKALEFLESSYSLDAYSLMCLSICLVVSKKYDQALSTLTGLFETTGRKEFSQIGYFLESSSIEKVVELFILANEPPHFFPQVQNYIEMYQKDSRGKSLIAMYAYILFYLINNKDEDVKKWAHKLHKKSGKKYKDLNDVALIALAIINQNKEHFLPSFNHLLSQHHHLATVGALGETPEGFFCLSAMALAKIAFRRNLISDLGEMNHFYCETNYLQFLQNKAK